MVVFVYLASKYSWKECLQRRSDALKLHDLPRIPPTNREAYCIWSLIEQYLLSHCTSLDEVY